MDIQRLVTRGDGSRSARPRLDLKGLRTGRIQRRQQKGFLLTPADSDCLLLRPPRWRLGPRSVPRGDSLTTERKTTAGSQRGTLFFKHGARSPHPAPGPGRPEQTCGTGGGSATAPQCPLSRVLTPGSLGRGASPHGPPPVPPAGAAAGPRPGRPVQSAAEWGPALMARGPPSAPSTWPCSRRPPLCFSMVHVAHGLPGLEAEFVLRSGHCVVDLVSVQIGDLRCKCPAATQGTWSSPPQTICPPPRVPAHPSLSPAVSPWSAKWSPPRTPTPHPSCLVFWGPQASSL